MFKLSTHSGKLERWLGKENVEHLSLCMRGATDETRWYGRPIAVAGVPGRVYVGRDGDFRGRIMNGLEASAWDVAESMFRRLKRGFQVAAREQLVTANSGFSSLSNLIQATTVNGQRRMYSFQKVGVAGAATAQSSSLWQSANQPSAGGAASAAPGGRIPTSSTTGAIPFANPAGGTTQHLLAAFPIATVINSTLLLYDRLFDVAKTASSSVTEAVSGVPTRYTNTSAGTVDSAENNFLFMEGQSVLAGVAHNWTVCKYTNQAGTPNQTLPSIAGNSSNAAQRFDQPINQWFAPLAAGDSGISALTQMQCSVATVTGNVNFVIGHPIAWMPHPIANQICTYDGTTTAYNFERIFDNACLALAEPVRPTTTACTYTGTISAAYN